MKVKEWKAQQAGAQQEALTDEEFEKELADALAAQKARNAAANGNGGTKPKAHKSRQVVPVAAPRVDTGGDETFTDEGEWKEDRPTSWEEAEERLSYLDEVQYQQTRHAKAQEWKIELKALDRIFKASRRLWTYRQAKQKTAPAPDVDELKHRLAYIMDYADGSILDLWIKSWRKVMAGEERNAKLLYLVATSRLFDNTMHAAVKGPSSGGKSQIRKQVLEFFPPEDVVNFTTLSEKALLYHQGDFCHKILSMAEAVGSEQWEFQDLLLRELMSEGKLVYPCVQKIHGNLVTQNIVKNGPVSFIVTTTKAALHPENETRMLSLEIDDSDGQTKRVLRKQAKMIGRNIRPDGDIHFDWIDYQRLLRIVSEGTSKVKVAVAVPFADALAELIPPKAVRLRRDFAQIIACIKAHAFIHVFQRDRNERGEIVADLDLDYVPVADLVGHIASEGAGIAVSKDVLATIEAVRIITADPNMPPDEGARALQVGKRLTLDKSTASRRLAVAAEKGFVFNMEEKRNRPGRWRVTDQEVEAESLLPTADEIREHEDERKEEGDL